MTKQKSHVYSGLNEEGDIVKTVSSAPRKIDRDLNVPPEYLNLGMYLVIPLMLGVMIGIYLDNSWKAGGKFTLIGIGFGTISIFYNLYKLYKKG